MSGRPDTASTRDRKRALLHKREVAAATTLWVERLDAQPVVAPKLAEVAEAMGYSSWKALQNVNRRHGVRFPDILIQARHQAEEQLASLRVYALLEQAQSQAMPLQAPSMQLPPWHFGDDDPRPRAADVQVNRRAIQKHHNALRAHFVAAARDYARTMQLAEFYECRGREVEWRSGHRMTPRELAEFCTALRKAGESAQPRFEADLASLSDDAWMSAAAWFGMPQERLSSLPEPLVGIAERAIAPLLRTLADFGYKPDRDKIAEPDWHNVFGAHCWPAELVVERDIPIVFGESVTYSRRQVAERHPVSIAWLNASGAARALPSPLLEQPTKAA
jgi:hypothetical protein